MSRQWITMRNKAGMLLFLPKTSRWEDRQRERRERLVRRSLTVVATACLMLAAGVAVALYSNVAYGRY